jgi:hypothetical protein
VSTQFAAKRRELDAEAAEIDAALAQAIETKNYAGVDGLQKRIDRLADDRAALDHEEEVKKSFASDPRFAALRGSSGDVATVSTLTGTPRGALSNIRPNGNAITTTGGMLQPLEFDNHAVSVLSKAFDAKTPVSTLVTKTSTRWSRVIRRLRHLCCRPSWRRVSLSGSTRTECSIIFRVSRAKP